MQNVLLTPLPFHFYFPPPPQFCYFPCLMFLFPRPQFYCFTSSFLNSLLLHKVNLFQALPHSWIASASIFIILPPQSWFSSSSTILLFSLLLLHLLIYSIYFSIQKYIDLMLTLKGTYMDQLFLNTASWIVKLYTTTTTFLLFSLLLLISIVFPRKGHRGQNQA